MEWAGVCGVSPEGLTPAQLFAMAEGRRKEDRTNIIQQAGVIWRTGMGNPLSKSEAEDFIQFGATGSKSKSLPANPAVDAKVKEIEANGGRLIVPVNDG